MSAKYNLKISSGKTISGSDAIMASLEQLYRELKEENSQSAESRQIFIKPDAGKNQFTVVKSKTGKDVMDLGEFMIYYARLTGHSANIKVDSVAPMSSNLNEQNLRQILADTRSILGTTIDGMDSQKVGDEILAFFQKNGSVDAPFSAKAITVLMRLDSNKPLEGKEAEKKIELLKRVKMDKLSAEEKKLLSRAGFDAERLKETSKDYFYVTIKDKDDSGSIRKVAKNSQPARGEYQVEVEPKERKTTSGIYKNVTVTSKKVLSAEEELKKKEIEEVQAQLKTKAGAAQVVAMRKRLDELQAMLKQ